MALAFGGLAVVSVGGQPCWCMPSALIATYISFSLLLTSSKGTLTTCCLLGTKDIARKSQHLSFCPRFCSESLGLWSLAHASLLD